MSSEPRHQTVTVEVTSLDLALQTESPSLVKIDVEGYETPLLEVAQQSLKNPALHCLIMELNGSGSRYGFDESQILELMFDHGFETFSYNPFDRRLSNLKGKNPSSGNTLFVRDKGLVLERLARAPKVSIHGTHF
jgi:hypothetical protein